MAASAMRRERTTAPSTTPTSTGHARAPVPGSGDIADAVGSSEGPTMAVEKRTALWKGPQMGSLRKLRGVQTRSFPQPQHLRGIHRAPQLPFHCHSLWFVSLMEGPEDTGEPLPWPQESWLREDPHAPSRPGAQSPGTYTHRVGQQATHFRPHSHVRVLHKFWRLDN